MSVSDPAATPADDPSDQAAKEPKPKLNLQVKVDKSGECQRHVTVTIPRTDIERYYDDAFTELRPKAEVPGFRPGRAPRKLVETRFRDQVTDQVKGSLLMDSMTQVNEDNDFSAISEPDFNVDAVVLPNEGDMTFEFTLEVRPDFELPAWEGLKLSRPVHEYSDEDVREQLDKLRGRYADLVPVDEPAQANDHLVINLTSLLDGKKVAHLDEQTVQLRKTLSFGDGQIEDFDQLMSGVKAGETRECNVTLSDDLENEAMQGKEVQLRIEVLDVKRLELAEVNQTFLNRVGGFEDEGDLLDAIREELERQFNYRQQQHVRQQITGQLTSDANWDLPPDLLRRQAGRELERAVMELRASGFDDNVIKAHQNQLRQNSVSTTRTALKEHFILERIAEDNELEAESDDYDMEIVKIALQSNESPRKVRARLEKRNQMDTLRNQIIERKVIELIMSKAEFTDEPYEAPAMDTEAVDFHLSGAGQGSEIPEAQHGGEAEPLREPADYT